jgi:integrase
VYARRLAAFSEQMKVEPLALPKQSVKELRDLLLDFITEEERKKRAGSYIESTTKAVKSWLAHSGVKLTLPIRIHGATDTPSLREERTPTQDELRAILLAATPKDRVSCSLMAFAGVRPEVLGNYRGNDGLRLGDFKDLKISGMKVEFDQTPALIEVRKELSKAGNRYFTYVGEEACGYVRQYLEDRLRAGEKLSPESDLIHPKGAGGFHDKAFVTTINIGDGIRKSIRGAGFKWRPYVLRAFFDTQLLLAESKGKLAHDYRVFWMGHKGSMEARYTTNKGRLPTELLDDMRAAYKRCEPFLSTNSVPAADQSLERVYRIILKMAGHTEAEMQKFDLPSMTPDQVEEAVNKKLGSKSAGLPTQKVVAGDIVESLLSEGWEYVAQLEGGRVVVKPPNAGYSPGLVSLSPEPGVP